jgi:myxalamid-type polyketide synthase MxaB
LDGKVVQSILRQLVKVQSQTVQAPTSAIVLEKLKTAPESEREGILHQYAQQQVVKTLGLDPSKSFETQRMLADIGMDSLMAVELKNKIDGDFGMNIPVSYFLEKATVAGLARMLLEQFGNGNNKSAFADALQKGNGHNDAVIDSETAKSLLSNLDQLSEDEVNSLLNSMLVEEEKGS